jgi:hypothetical protein
MLQGLNVVERRMLAVSHRDMFRRRLARRHTGKRNECSDERDA